MYKYCSIRLADEACLLPNRAHAPFFTSFLQQSRLTSSDFGSPSRASALQSAARLGSVAAFIRGVPVLCEDLPLRCGGLHHIQSSAYFCLTVSVSQPRLKADATKRHHRSEKQKPQKHHRSALPHQRASRGEALGSADHLATPVLRCPFSWK